MAGRSINIFIPDLDRKDFRIATIPNWAGSVLTASESLIGELLEREEAIRHGCYIMMSGDRYEGGASAYIGQTDNLRRRLKEHDKSGRGWERIAFISTSDTSFSGSHFLFIEAQMIADAVNSASVNLENGNGGRASRGNLGEAQSADAESFLDNIKFVLPVIGFDIFKRRIRTPDDVVEGDVPKSGPIELQLSRKRVLMASGRLEDDIITVLAGSKVLAEHATVSTGYKALRDSLIEQGVISIDTNGGGHFTADFDFKSPSAASAVILGRNDNGRTSWRLASDTKVSLGQYLTGDADDEAEIA